MKRSLILALVFTLFSAPLSAENRLFGEWHCSTQIALEGLDAELLVSQSLNFDRSETLYSLTAVTVLQTTAEGSPSLKLFTANLQATQDWSFSGDTLSVALREIVKFTGEIENGEQINASPEEIEELLPDIIGDSSGTFSVKFRDGQRMLLENDENSYDCTRMQSD